MVNTSTRPITVDGLRLDTLGYNVTKIGRAAAARNPTDLRSPFTDGVVPSTWDYLEPAVMGLQMWVRGTDIDGVVPGVGQVTQLQNNLDELLHLFGKRHALLDVQEQVDAGGTLRRAWCKVTDVMAPDLNDVGTVAQFAVALQIPSGSWEDVNSQDWVGATGAASLGTTQEITTLQGATERINDAAVLVLGPATNPRVTDAVTGTYVQYNGTLASGTNWWVNSANWTSKTGAGLTLTSAAAGGGANVDSVTTWGGIPITGGGPYLPLTPVRDTGLRRVKVILSGTAGGAATGIQARTKRHWMV